MAGKGTNIASYQTLIPEGDADAHAHLAQDGSIVELHVQDHIPQWQRQSLRESLWHRMEDALRQRRTHNAAAGDSVAYLDEEDGELPPYRGSNPHSQASGKARRTWTSVIVWGIIAILALFGLFQIFSLLFPSKSHSTKLAIFSKPSRDANGVLRYPTDFTKDIHPVPVHSHNDYWRSIPLYEALSYGCVGVEADVWHLDNELLVGHDKSSLTPSRTFRSLYVDPLVELLDKRNSKSRYSPVSHNGVFDEDPSQTVVLLVDLKTDGRETFPVVLDQLSALRSKGYLAHFDGKVVKPGAVTVVMTGNTPFDLVIANETYRDVFFDAPLVKIWQDSSHSTGSEKTSNQGSGQGMQGLDGIDSAAVFTPENSYYASVSFSKAFGWPQLTRLSDSTIEKIKSQIEAVHEQGLKVRYWDTPTWPIWVRNHVWKVLTELGADMLNADDLEAAATKDWR